MIEYVFTLDYEIYGNGLGSLKQLILEPAEKLLTLFREQEVRFVVFVEAAELEAIESRGTDDAIDAVKQQIRNFHREGFEIGLHIHPQWNDANYEKGKWQLNYNNYNLCYLPRERIADIIEHSIKYLRRILNINSFTPLSYRAGNWLFQPTQPTASILADWGIKIDSSVFKGGVQHTHGLDYRNALKNGYYWRFENDVNLSDPQGKIVELPTYTRMVPTWQALTAKRVRLQRKSPSGPHASNERANRLKDMLRFHYPKKLDFCRMTTKELISFFEIEKKKDKMNPSLFRPIVAIGHTKDLIDLNTVEMFLTYLKKNQIPVSTFRDVYHQIGAIEKFHATGDVDEGS